MKESYFIGASEVKEIVGCSKSRAYQFIQQMNKELEAKGLLTFLGRVPRRYVFERFGITDALASSLTSQFRRFTVKCLHNRS